MGQIVLTLYSKESNELIDILLSVASLTKIQTESFEVRTQALQEELGKLTPELSNFFQGKSEEFVQDIHNEYQSYQAAVAKLMDDYAEKIAKAENSISGVPLALEVQLQKERAENVADLKQIQERYAVDLARTNDSFSKQIQSAVNNIQAVPSQLREDSAQQYGSFLRELDKLMSTRLVQLAETERRVADFSQQLEIKYSAFVAKLEATNMNRLYKYCQDMNKTINTKLGFVLGGVVVAIIVSIVSLFI